MLKKKIWANFRRIVEDSTQKIFNMLSNIWVWDPGSGIRQKTYSGSRIQGSKRHRIPDPEHWLTYTGTDNSYLQFAVFWLGRQRTELALDLRFAGGNLHRKTPFNKTIRW
jgi:hypothetical protein